MNTGNGDRVTEAGRVSAAMIDSAGWGVFFIWVGIALVANVGWGVALLGTGIISLGAQGARSRFALKADRWGVAIGACLFVAGLMRWLDIPLDKAPLPSWPVPGLFVVFGVAILVSIWVRRHKG
jgi:hypothetical protein